MTEVVVKEDVEINRDDCCQSISSIKGTI